MSTITDQLITVLKLTGANEYAHGMHQAASAVKDLAKANSGAGVASAVAGSVGGGGLARALAGISGAALGTAAVLGGLAVGAKESLSVFAESEQQIFRTTVVLKNLGSSLPIGEVQEFGNQMQALTGVDDEAVVSIVGVLKRFGAQDSAVKGLTKSVLDLSAATGINYEHAATAVGHAVIGNARMLRQLGIEFKSTGDRARDLAAIQEKLNDLFGGAAEARKNTLAGSFEALKNAFDNLLQAIGSRLATVIVPVVNALTTLVTFLADNVALFTTGLGALAGFLVGGPLGALIGAAAGLGLGLLPEKGNAAEGIGTGKGRLATEDTLSKIETNTKNTSDALIQAVLGGAGTVAKGAFTYRDFRLSFNF